MGPMFPTLEGHLRTLVKIKPDVAYWNLWCCDVSYCEVLVDMMTQVNVVLRISLLIKCLSVSNCLIYHLISNSVEP